MNSNVWVGRVIFLVYNIFVSLDATLTVQQLPPSVSEGGMLTVCVGISGISLASSTINIPVVLSLGGDTSGIPSQLIMLIF